MYHAESNTPALARTSNLNEELGQVISSSCPLSCFQFEENSYLVTQLGVWDYLFNAKGLSLYWCRLHLCSVTLSTS
jgi:hypothetical protein